jgi:hypothetical protein
LHFMTPEAPSEEPLRLRRRHYAVLDAWAGLSSQYSCKAPLFAGGLLAIFGGGHYLRRTTEGELLACSRYIQRRKSHRGMCSRQQMCGPRSRVVGSRRIAHSRGKDKGVTSAEKQEVRSEFKFLSIAQILTRKSWIDPAAPGWDE